MPSLVEQSKFREETISVIVSFSDMMDYPGEVISGTPLVSVVVFSGIDASPESILYEGTYVTQGYLVENRYRNGIPGVIYLVTVSATTSLGNSVEKDFYLAILPEDGTAVPEYLAEYKTSSLYPLYTEESITNGVSFFRGFVSPYSNMDAIVNGVSFPSAQILGGAVVARSPLESIYNGVSFTNASILGSLVVANAPMESITNGVAVTSISILGSLVVYTSPGEGIFNGVSFNSASSS